MLPDEEQRWLQGNATMLGIILSWMGLSPLVPGREHDSELIKYEWKDIYKATHNHSHKSCSLYISVLEYLQYIFT